MKIVSFPGTGEWPSTPDTPAWFDEGSEFSGVMLDAGYEQAIPPALPSWSSALAGVRDRKDRAWHYGVAVTLPRVEQLDEADRNLIGASHGGQVAAIIASKVPCRRLITIGTPVRKELADIYAQVSCPWLHVYSTGWENRWQSFGQLFDGQLSLNMKMPDPAVNRRLEGIGHVKLVRIPANYLVIYQTIILPFLERGA